MHGEDGPYVRVGVYAGRLQGRWDPDAAGHVVEHAADVVVPRGREGRAAWSAGEGAVEVRVHVVLPNARAAAKCLVLSTTRYSTTIVNALRLFDG